MLPTTASTGPKYLRTIARGMSSGARSLLANFHRSQPTTSILSTRFLFADQCRQHLSSPKPCDSTQALQIHNTKLPLEQEIYRRFTNMRLPVENMSLVPAAFVADVAGTIVPCCCYFASIARPSSGKCIHVREMYDKYGDVPTMCIMSQRHLEHRITRSLNVARQSCSSITEMCSLSILFPSGLVSPN